MTPILSTLLSSSHSKSFAENGVAFVCEWRTVSPLPCASREIFTAPGKLLVTRFPVFPFSITAPYSKPFLFAESRRTRNVSASTFDRLRGDGNHQNYRHTRLAALLFHLTVAILPVTVSALMLLCSRLLLPLAQTPRYSRALTALSALPPC